MDEARQALRGGPDVRERDVELVLGAGVDLGHAAEYRTAHARIMTRNGPATPADSEACFRLIEAAIDDFGQRTGVIDPFLMQYFSDGPVDGLDRYVLTSPPFFR